MSNKLPHYAACRPEELHGDLSFLSWNINDSRTSSEGSKAGDSDFTSVLTNHDIFCLQETKDCFTIPNYSCFNSNRPDSRSGGVCIGIKKSLAKGVAQFKTRGSHDIIGVTLKAKFFNLSQDLVILNVYNSPNNSSYTVRKQLQGDSEFVPTLDALEDILLSIPPNRSVLLVGDFNARSGNLEDTHQQSLYPGCSDLVWDTEYPSNLPNRSNKDGSTNANGRTLLQLAKSANLIILNGRTVGDIFGDFTCYKYNGASVVDYMCASSDLYDYVKFMKVMEFTIFSDHRPLSAAICADASTNAKLQSLSQYMDAPKPFNWKQGDIADEESSSFKYLEAQKKPNLQAKVRKLLDRIISSPEDAAALNNDSVQLLSDLAGIAAPKNQRKKTNHKKWFDWDCRSSKRNLKKLSTVYSKKPFDNEARRNFHEAKKFHKHLIKSKKEAYLRSLNEKVNQEKMLDWKSFKRLKEEQREVNPFDAYDIGVFYSFFKDLYNRSCSRTPNNHQNDDFSQRKRDKDIPDSLKAESLDSLNADFSEVELDVCINNLKNNKSVSTDLISNEMIRYTNKQTRALLLKLFNGCLNQGLYPWNSSLTTPIHKKGDKQNPDNYRAITVGSCLGKLFSTLLLNRLHIYRSTRCPDYPNQLGFCKGAQCNDHVLTLKTLVEKYVSKQRKKLFTCFVDYRKAFDLVCRDALL